MTNLEYAKNVLSADLADCDDSISEDVDLFVDEILNLSVRLHRLLIWHQYDTPNHDSFIR